LPDTSEIRADVAGFKTSVRTLDQGIGDVLAALEATGLAENTLVIYTTDHGIAFPGMKSNLTDGGIGVSLLLRGPGGFTGGTVSDALVSHLDLYPTICDLSNIDAPEWLQGKSLVPLMRGDVDKVRDAIFAEINYHAAYEPQRAIRTARYKYIRHYDERTVPVLPNTDDSPGKELWIKSGWQQRPVAAERLYDLIFDPGEACNVASNPDFAQVLSEMRTSLEQWMQETQDPLLYGGIPYSSGVVVNDPDQISPQEPTHPLSS
jgi:arylsulfatase A-like enzyme